MSHSPLIQTDPETAEKTHEDVHEVDKAPSTGRTSPLGRKVEKPGEYSAGGPSGQHVTTNHEKKHANN